MTLKQKIDRFFAETRKEQINDWTAAPPFVRLFWLCGLDVAPPYYWSFATSVIIFGGVFALLIFGAEVFVLREHQSWHRPAISCAIFGMIFGLFMTILTRHRVKRISLPSWRDDRANDL